MRVQKPEARQFYEVECSKARWSVRELERQIGSLLYERLALSRKREGMLALAEQGPEPFRPEDLVKDPYVLEFTGLPEAGDWQESDLEAVLIERLQQFLLELGRDLFFVARQKRLTIDGDHFNEAVVRYTLSETTRPIFASRYQLHLPTEEELARELRREREIIEQQFPEPS